MQLFRKHMVKWVLSLLLTVGMTAYLAVPYSSKAQKTAFAQWLDRNVEDNDDNKGTAVRTQIKEMAVQSESFPLLLEKASILVNDYKNNFKLPFQHDAAAGSTGAWLVDLWSQDRQEANKVEFVLPETIHSAVKWVSQNTPQPANLSSSVSNLKTELSRIFQRPIFVVQDQPLPFLSGISINAP